MHIVGNNAEKYQQLLRMEHSGAPQMTFRNSVSGTNWGFGFSLVDDFIVSVGGSGQQEAVYRKNDDMEIAGTLTQNSDRDNKQAIQPIDGVEVLETVARLPISTWEYKGRDGEKHLGPMAQDFHAAFGLGHTPKGISSIDTGGVALAAIKGLNEVVQAKDQ